MPNKKITLEKIKEGFYQNSSQAHLTLISIILSVALGFMMSKVFGVSSGITPQIAFHGATVFLAIVGIFYYYSTHMAISVYPPRIIQYIITFSIGSSIIASAIYIGNTIKFWWAFFSLLLTSTLGFLNTIMLNVYSEWGSDDNDIKGMIKNEAAKNIVIFSAMAALTFITLSFLPNIIPIIPPPLSIDSFLFSINVMLYIICVFITERKFLSSLFEKIKN